MSCATVRSPLPESLHEALLIDSHSFKVVQRLYTASFAQLMWIPVLQVDIEGSACLHVAQQLCRWGFLPQLHHFLNEFQTSYAAKTRGQEHGALLRCAASCKTALQDLAEVHTPHTCLGRFSQVAFRWLPSEALLASRSPHFGLVQHQTCNTCLMPCICFALKASFELSTSR